MNRKRLSFFSAMVGMYVVMSLIPVLGVAGEFVAAGAIIAILGAKWFLGCIPFAVLFNSEYLYPLYKCLSLIVDIFLQVWRLAERVPAAFHGLAYLFALDYYGAVAPVVALLCSAVYLRRQVARRLGGRMI